MTVQSWGGSLALSVIVLFVALLLLVLVGVRVVKKHPAEYDPARNAKRYTYPAGIFAGIAGAALVWFGVSLVGFIVAALT